MNKVTGRFERNIYIQDSCGITELSKQYYLQHKADIGDIESISCHGKPKEAEYKVIITGSKSAIWVDGFSWGYMGEGPKGLRWLLENAQCGTPLNRNMVFEKPAKEIMCFLRFNGYSK